MQGSFFGGGGGGGGGVGLRHDPAVTVALKEVFQKWETDPRLIL